MTSCADCPIPAENRIQYESLPAEWCKTDYECPVALTEWPGKRFFYWLTLLKLQKGGYTIENNRLAVEDWIQLGELKEALERHKETQNLMNLANSMQVALLKAPAKR